MVKTIARVVVASPLLINLMLTAAKNGDVETRQVDFGVTLTATIIDVAILWMGGFFR